MPISYTKEQWSSLSIQDRIKAMNNVVEQEDDEVLQEELPKSPALEELPKRTSVVDMWRQRENPSTTSAKPVLKNTRTSPAQINSESDAARKNGAIQPAGMGTSIEPGPTKLGGEGSSSTSTSKRTSVEELFKQRNATSKPTPALKQVSTKYDDTPKDLVIFDDDEPPQPETKKLSVVDRWSKKGLTGAPAAPATVTTPAKSIPESNQMTDTDNGPTNRWSSVADMWNSKLQGAQKWNHRAVASTSTYPKESEGSSEQFSIPSHKEEMTLQIPANLDKGDQTMQALKKTWNQGKSATSSWPTSALENAAATPSWKKPSKLAQTEPIADIGVTSAADQEKDALQQLGPKSEGIQQSWNQQKSTTPSWQKPDTTKSAVASPAPLWRKPIMASPAEMQDASSGSTIGKGETPGETPMVTSKPTVSKWGQKSQPSQQSWSQRNGSHPSWQKPAVESTAEVMEKPGAAQMQTPSLASSWQKPAATSASSPRDWKNPLRQSSSSVAGSASWQKPEEAGNKIPSWKENRAGPSGKGVRATEVRGFSPGSSVTDSRHKQMPFGILGEEKKKRANFSIDMSTKDEVDNSRSHEDSAQDLAAPGDDGTLATDASSVMDIWRKRESLSAQSTTPMSPQNRNLSWRKPPVMLAAKRSPLELKYPAATADATDEPRQGVAAAENNQPPLSKQAQRSETDTIVLAVEESVGAALDWPTADESEYVEQPAATGHPSPKRAYTSSIFEKWKKRHSGVVVDESKPSPVKVGETQVVDESKPSPMKVEETQKAASSSNGKMSGSSTGNVTKTSRSFDQSSKQTSSSGGEVITVKSDIGSPSRNGKALELFKQKQKQQKAEEETINKKVKPSLMELGKKHRLGNPTRSGSVEEKKDGDDSVILVADDHPRLGASPLKDHIEGKELSLAGLLKPISSAGIVVERTKDSPKSGLARISYRPTPQDADSINPISGFEGLPDEPTRLVSKAITMVNPGLQNQLSPISPGQIIESPTRKLSRTIEKKRVQEHRQRLRQIRQSDLSVSSVESSLAFEGDSVSQTFSDTVPDHFEAAKHARKESKVDGNKKSKLARSEYPYSPPTEYGKLPMYEKMNPMSPAINYIPSDKLVRHANFEVGPLSPAEPSAVMQKKGRASRSLKVQVGQSAFSSPTNSGCGAFSLYSRAKSEDSSSPLASPSTSSTRSFSYRSTNRYKHKKELAARARLIPAGAQQPSNMSDAGQSDTALSFFSASTGYSARSIYSVKSNESEESSNVGSSTLASRASLMLKGRRNKLSQKSPEDERTAKDLYRRMLQGQSSRQQPSRRDRTAAYAPSHRANANGGDAEFKKAQREGLSSRYNSSSRFTDACTSQGPVAHNFRGSACDHPQKTYSFGSQASENSSNLYSPSSRSERSDGSDPWVGGDGALSIEQRHSVSTDGTRADEGDFGELQSAYRDMDLAQMAIDLKEEVQTSFKGSVQEVTAMVSKLLTSPVVPLQSPSRINPSKLRMKTPKRTEAEDEEIAIEVQYIGEVDEDAESAGEIEKANSNSRSSSSQSFTRHGAAAGQPSHEQAEQAARRGLV